MASNPPGACCLKKSDHEGTPIGVHKELYGLNTYVSGDLTSKKLIVIITDIYGNHLNNVLLIADEFGKKGYKVYIPDVLKGDDAVENVTDLPAWLPNHSNEITRPIVESFLDNLYKGESFDFLGLVGYCFGAKYVVQQLTKDSRVTAGAIAHPSFVSVEEVEAVAKPLIISAAETDPIFPEDLRYKTEDILRKTGVHYQIDLFSGVAHGYSVRGDI